MTTTDDAFFDTPETDNSIKWAKRPVNTRDLRKTHEYQTAHDAYRRECAAHRQPDGTYGDPCIRCSEPIDYNLHHPHPLAWSLEHKIPVEERPDLLLDKNNFASAHFGCNSMYGPTRVESDIGTPSEEW